MRQGLGRLLKSPRVPLVLFVFIFAGIGTYFIVASRADTACTTTIGSGLNAAIANANGGDTICLNAGNYGDISLSNVNKSSAVTIQPSPGVATTAVIVPSLTINGADHLNFQSLTIGSVDASTGYSNSGLDLEGDSNNITIAHNTFIGGSQILLNNGTTGDLIDSNTFNNINRSPDDYEGRVQIEDSGTGLQVSNNYFSGGCSDGIQTGSDGGDIGPGNEFTNIQQNGCDPLHVDPLQLYGAANVDIHDNYFLDNNTGIMAPDGGTDETITGNVFSYTDGYPALTLGSHHGDVIEHNTSNVAFRLDGGNSGQQGSGNTVENNIIGDGFYSANDGNMSVEDYNIISNGATVGGTGAHDIKGTPTFVGGTNPTTLAGWQLAAGSIGTKAATDGTNIGASAPTAAGTPTPPVATTPTVAMAAPANNASVSGTVTVSATTSDSVKISSVQFQLDGKNLGPAVTAPASGSTYNYAWNTAGVSSGSHTLMAVVADSSNTTAKSAAVTVNLAAAAPTTSAASSCFASPGSCGYPDPAAHNVGVANCSALTASGSITKTTTNQTIQNLNITGTISVTSNNVTINNVCVKANGGGQAGSSAITVADGVTGLNISNSSIGGANASSQSVESAVAYDHDGNGGTLSKDYLYQCGECVHGPWTVNDSYVIANGMVNTGDHYEDWYFNDATISANHDTMFNPEPQTAIVFGDTNSGDGGAADNHITFTNSLVAGSGFAFYPYGNASSIGSSSSIGTMNISNNRFARCLLNGAAPTYDSSSGGRSCPGMSTALNASDGRGYFPYTGVYGVADYYATGTCQTWSGNTYDDNGATVNITDDGSQSGINILKAPTPGMNYNCTTGSATNSSPAVPPSPTNLTKTAATTTSISLSWADNAPSVGGYQIFRNGTQVGTATTASYTDTGLTAGTGYSYTVEAYDASATSNLSLPSDPPLTASTNEPQQSLTPPTSLKLASPAADNAVSLAWTASASKGVNQYDVVRSSANSPATTIATLGNVTSYTDTTVAPDTAYSYYVIAGNSSSFSGASNTVTTTTANLPVVTPPAAPTIPVLAALAVSPTQVNLSWTASTYSGGNIAGYDIYRSDKGAQPYATVLAGTTTWGESGLAPGTGYTYSVRAFVTASVVSALSTPAGIVTPPATTTGSDSGSGSGSGSTAAFLGTRRVSKQTDNNSSGMAEIFQTTATHSGSISKIKVYIDKSSKSRRVTVGIYQNRSGHPGTLLTQGSLINLRRGTWNTFQIPQIPITTNQTYWIAILGTGRGTVAFRDSTPKHGKPDTVSASTNLTTLPGKWTAGQTYNNSPLSAYATN